MLTLVRSFFCRATLKATGKKDVDVPGLLTKNIVIQKKRPFPNYFVAFRISNPEIHQLIGLVQQHVVKQESRLEKYLVKLPKLHITLMVMNLEDSEQHAKALEVLKAIHSSYNESMSKDPLELEVKGLGNFKNRVLFADITRGSARDRLVSFAGDVIKQFAEASIISVDKRELFSPHLTVMKISHPSRGKAKSLSKINPALYSLYKDQVFGTQVVRGIQLLKMVGEDEQKYFPGTELLFDIPD